MSEPLGTEGYGDVVSSVRRLVSPEARPRVISRDLRLDRLVLTQALRVVGDGDELPMLILSVPATDCTDQPDAEESVGVAGPLPDPAVADSAAWEDAVWIGDIPSPAEEALEAQLAAAPDSDPWGENDDWSVSPREGALPEADVLPFPHPAGANGPQAATMQTSDLIDADGNPVTVLDEAALNEIVRVLIREELQGVLGERITHNVRKLVRAEINRALTARLLD